MRLPRLEPCAHQLWSARFLGLTLLCLACPACRLTDVPLWKVPAPAPGRTCEVERIRDVAYYSGPGAHSERHRLDLFLPKGLRGFPVVLLVHGGAWIAGDNRCCGLYSSVGEFLARNGIGAALINYRLSPRVRHPEHVKDVARAFAWVHEHAADYGGRPDQLFLLGHSAGGHLVALLATDEKYLQAEGLSSADIRGVIAVGGVYDIPAGPLEITLGGGGHRAFRVGQILPMRRPCWGRGVGALLPGIPLGVNVFGPAFGNDPLAREDASALRHVRPGLPPFLLCCAEEDLPTLPEMAEDFDRALREQGVQSQLLRVPGRNHQSQFFCAALPGDPVGGLLLTWIRGHLEAPPP